MERRRDSIRCVTVAVAQVSTCGTGINDTLSKLEKYVAEAKSRRAKLILFPEAFIGGYPRGLSFGSSFGRRTTEGRREFAQYFSNSIMVPGKVCDRIAKLARANNIFIAVGVIEQELGSLFSSVIFFDPFGSFLGKHRKLLPTASERLTWGRGDGSTLHVFNTDIGKLGAAICWENYMPLLRASYYAKGIEIYLAPTADGTDTWLPSMRHIAVEGRCFVLSCNQFSNRADFPENFNTNFGDNPDTIINVGGSCIVGPDGAVIVEPVYGREELLVADIDLSTIPQWKYDLDVSGHYSRPDIFKLSVDVRPQEGVSFLADTQ